jgi:hypothetical protein
VHDGSELILRRPGERIGPVVDDPRALRPASAGSSRWIASVMAFDDRNIGVSALAPG